MASVGGAHQACSTSHLCSIRLDSLFQCPGFKRIGAHWFARQLKLLLSPRFGVQPRRVVCNKQCHSAKGSIKPTGMFEHKCIFLKKIISFHGFRMASRQKDLPSTMLVSAKGQLGLPCIQAVFSHQMKLFQTPAPLGCVLSAPPGCMEQLRPHLGSKEKQKGEHTL